MQLSSVGVFEDSNHHGTRSQRLIYSDGPGRALHYSGRILCVVSNHRNVRCIDGFHADRVIAGIHMVHFAGFTLYSGRRVSTACPFGCTQLILKFLPVRHSLMVSIHFQQANFSVHKHCVRFRIPLNNPGYRHASFSQPGQRSLSLLEGACG